MGTQTPYYVGFSHCYGIGPLKFATLTQYFGTAERAYKASLRELEKAIGQGWAFRFNTFRRQFNLEKKCEEIEKKNITAVGIDDFHYPDQLKHISDPPICLYVKGDINCIDFGKTILFGVVGTRQPTSYGQQIAYKFSSELSMAGFVIVSGLALGIDTIAHKAALQNKGKTIAVLGCGVDIPYPSSNYRLYHEIVDGGGIVISEFPPGMTVLKGLFIARNRIISGLSVGVLVAEGAKDSGALITARYAAEQGKDVFAPPVPITSVMSEAPNALLKQGATFVTQVEDILNAYGMKKIHVDQIKISHLTNEEKSIVDFLIKDSKSADELACELKKPISFILNTLSILEMNDIVSKDNEGKYQIQLTGK